MTTLANWAARWQIPPAALADLRAQLLPPPVTTPAKPGSEAAVQNAVRLAAARNGFPAWRNNCGALLDRRGVPVRFGLANDSPAMNAALKSADLIGCRPVVITAAHVGHTVGQFWSRECKEPGWRFNPNDKHERAQMAWAELVLSLGGDAGFLAAADY